MNWLKMFMLFRRTDASNLVKIDGYNTKISEIQKKILDYNHDKYITTK